jgi:hypothetical protein
MQKFKQNPIFRISPPAPEKLTEHPAPPGKAFPGGAGLSNRRNMPPEGKGVFADKQMEDKQ